MLGGDEESSGRWEDKAETSCESSCLLHQDRDQGQTFPKGQTPPRLHSSAHHLLAGCFKQVYPLQISIIIYRMGVMMSSMRLLWRLDKRMKKSFEPNTIISNYLFFLMSFHFLQRHWFFEPTLISYPKCWFFFSPSNRKSWEVSSKRLTGQAWQLRNTLQRSQRLGGEADGDSGQPSTPARRMGLLE